MHVLILGEVGLAGIGLVSKTLEKLHLACGTIIGFNIAESSVHTHAGA